MSGRFWFAFGDVSGEILREKPRPDRLAEEIELAVG